MKSYTRLIAMSSMAYSDMMSFLSPRELSVTIEEKHKTKKITPSAKELSERDEGIKF